MLKKTLLSVAILATIIATPASAANNNNAIGIGAGVGGLILGGIIGNAMAQPSQPQYQPQPVYQGGGYYPQRPTRTIIIDQREPVVVRTIRPDGSVVEQWHCNCIDRRY